MKGGIILERTAINIAKILISPMAIMAGAVPGGKYMVKLLYVLTVYFVKAVSILVIQVISRLENKFTTPTRN